ncbi:uncharacterized protein MONBRDRAFT_14642 [Monosiga brevicollis MX1]|uniref:SNF2 family DNA-dependent ATPase n=1 Tax=Monosiga brevicollis TaxID=81824 RepID=A9URJ4_MONBE|nr:uncharacterized protein MONBRDRAFT_14642 [Monosiga brevicollis MX1]EDQ92254.1 predicted protein [Monosiga brevicollis MX1]|eukprot:XP_001743540.1 hypothetical protein [Monosiga brevicollis MX1]
MKWVLVCALTHPNSSILTSLLLFPASKPFPTHRVACHVLGKTVQAISFIAHLLDSPQREKQQPHLIIVPPSTHENWMRELEKWCPDIQVLDYSGTSPQAERQHLRRGILKKRIKFEVMVTTYSVCSNNEYDRSLLKAFKWSSVTFDEGHMLKNMKSQRFQNLHKIPAKRRVLLTGTPLQNNLLELMSLLVFVMPNLFRETDVVKRIFSRKSSGTTAEANLQASLVKRARAIMAPFVLRRLKQDVLSQLPPKRYRVIECSMTEEQNKASSPTPEGEADALASAADPSGRTNNVLMQLRKMANHPLLHRCHYKDDKLAQMAKQILRDPHYDECDEQAVYEDMQVMSDFELMKLCNKSRPLQKFRLGDEVVDEAGKLKVLEHLLAQKQADEARVLIFSQFTTMLDILEDFLTRRGYVFIRLDGSTPVSERQDLIDQFNEDEEIFVFLLSTRAGGLGINLTAANTVVLHDIDFNPYNDKQAEDRCHRVGQTDNVEIVRLIADETVEVDMQAKAEAKLQLERDMTGLKKDDAHIVKVQSSQEFLATPKSDK